MMTTPRVAVGAFIFDSNHRVLLVERAQPPARGLWTVPGGKVERGETLAQAVAREVREETGLTVEVGALACVVESISDEHHYVILDYLARVIAGELAPSSDVSAAKFVSSDELPSMALTSGLLPLIERARNSYRAWK